jgi:predicted nucleotidyltransferase component of viral defense system
VESTRQYYGGTALYKLHLKPAARYSEDIDLVQVKAEAAGPIMDALRDVLNPWLGEPRSKQSRDGVTFTYRFNSEENPAIPLKLKVEINTREHFSVNGFKKMPYNVQSRWFNGSCDINTYDLNELLGTKLRALYQRRKGSDLFDLALALENELSEPVNIVEVFNEYMKHGGFNVSRTQFENNLIEKLQHPNFVTDIGPLLSPNYEWNLDAMAALVSDQLICHIPE